MKNLMVICLLGLVVGLCGSVQAQTTYYVGPGESIQTAIGNAVSGDTVQVAAGTYYERITLKNGVAVIGAGESVTIIDGSAAGPVVTSSGCGPDTVLKGFTITNGSAYDGGGMHNYSSSPTVTNCTFSGNSADYDGGGGMYNYSSSPTVTNCTFSGNSAGNGGGMGNLASSSPTVTNCTFSENSAVYSGGGMYNHYYSNPTVTNCIMWGNTGNEIYNNFSSIPIISYSDIAGGYTGTGNIDADPLFVSGPWGDYYLSHIAAGQISNSPCIDTGSDLASALGMDTYTTRIDHITDAGQVDMGYHPPTDFPESPIDVLIDIKPGSDDEDQVDNTISLSAQGGLIPVAILSDCDEDEFGDLILIFDATTVDPATVVLAGASAEVRMKGEGITFMAQKEDVNGDGCPDLVVHIAVVSLIEGGAIQDGEAILTGETYDGQLIEGRDYVTIVPAE